MLRIVQSRSASGAKSYFSPGSYYADGQELPGVWRGETAKVLGLSGPIEQADFEALCDNLDPRSGKPLTVRTKSDRTIGYDFNFHVPKGVSLAYALRGDEQILTAFQESVQETMQDIEREALTRVRIDGKQEDRTTSNLVWGEFIHRTTRPVNGEEDPHLHAHCFVFNTTWDASEHRFKAAQFRELKRNAPYFEALADARFAKRLRMLGYPIVREGRQWDIAGFEQPLKDKFSRRTKLIEAEARQRGIADPDRKAELGAKTREAKQRDRSYSELQELWRARLDASERESLSTPLPAAAIETALAARHEAKLATEAAIAHCFEREAVIGERLLVAEALRRGVGHVQAADIWQEVAAQGVLTREIDGRRWATTPEVIREEQTTLDLARRGRGQAVALNDRWTFQRAWLSEEQQQAVRQLITSRDVVQILRGSAGTGKTTLMQEAVAAIQAGGRQVFTFAPSAAASKGVLRSEGFEASTTVAELLVNTQLQDRARGQVIWIDEAGLLSTPQLRAVLELTAQLQARLILGGDWKQHGSVQRGGMLRILEEQAGLKPAEVGSIRRQQGKYREAVEALAAQRMGEGFDRLDRLGWVHEIEDGARDQQIAHDYADAIKAGESALVVSPTHAEARHLTQEIRSELRSRKIVSEESQLLTRLEPLHYTESERRDAAFYQPGDVIVFHQNAPGFRKGQRLLVTTPPGEDVLKQAARFDVYRTQYLAPARGDRLRFTANVRTKDGKHRIHNGNSYALKGFTRTGDLVLSNNWVVDRGVGHLDFGYVTTSHASQGRTVDRVFIAESAESFGAAGREQFYVSVSRGRKQAAVYTDDKAELRAVVHASQAKVTATELLQTDRARQRMAERQRLWQQQAALAAPVVAPSLTPELQYGRQQ
jgi:conjugative relaxase-like TrwC/TraI family protein